MTVASCCYAHTTQLDSACSGNQEISSTSPEEIDFLTKVRMKTMQADRAVDPMSGKHEGERAIAQSAYHHYSLPSARLVLRAGCGDTLPCMQQRSLCTVWRQESGHNS